MMPCADDVLIHAPLARATGHAGYVRFGSPLASLALMAATVLALAGCGHDEYEDSYPATSGVIVEGGTMAKDNPADSSGAAPATATRAGQPDGPSDPQGGTILFMASPGGGLPPRVIARTDSITSAPTAEHLARDALATHRRDPAPPTTSGMTAPLITNGEDPAIPIALPDPTATPRTSRRITISRQTGVDDGPTILRIVESP